MDLDQAPESSPRPDRGRARGAAALPPDVRIGEAARVSGVSARSLRHYEDEGLIVPGRCGNGYRDYCGSTIDRVLVVRSLLESGLPIRLVREALDIDAPGLTSADFLHEVRGYRDRLAERIADLTARQAAIERYLRDADHTA